MADQRTASAEQFQLCLRACEAPRPHLFKLSESVKAGCDLLANDDGVEGGQGGVQPG